MSNEGEDLDIQEIRQKIEDYTTTIHALQSFVSLVTWNSANRSTYAGTHSSLGRRMDTTPGNRISPETTVTPDAVIQRSDDLGYLVEAKKSLPANSDRWDSVVEQLAKYDDGLIGWWTETEVIDVSSVVLLIEIARSAEFSLYLESAINSGQVEFTRPISVVEFTKSSELKEFLFIRKHWGDIADEEFSSLLAIGKKVPIEKVVGTYGSMKFYDAPPVVEHTMVNLWQDIFTGMKSDFPYDEEARAWLFNVTLESLTDDLQRLYGSSGNRPREVAFPRKAWIREAMNALVRLGYAEKAAESDEYVVYFKRVKGDVLERFSLHRASDDRGGVGTEPIQSSFLDNANLTSA